MCEGGRETDGQTDRQTEGGREGERTRTQVKL